jgi:hypothetical protein
MQATLLWKLREQVLIGAHVPGQCATAMGLRNLSRKRNDKQYPKEKVAVIYFSGRMTEGLIQKELTRLKKVVETMGYTLKDHYRLARYNSPFSLPFLRRNEILCSIEDKNE